MLSFPGNCLVKDVAHRAYKPDEKHLALLKKGSLLVWGETLKSVCSSGAAGW